MGNFIHQWLCLDPYNPNALTASNLYYDTQQTVKQKIDSMHPITFKTSFVMPSNSNEVLMLGEFSDAFATRNFYMSVTVLGSINISKVYTVSITSNHTEDKWFKLHPLNSTQIFHDDFDIDIKTDNTKCYLRVRRTKDNNKDVCGANIQISNLLPNNDSFTYNIPATPTLIYAPVVYGNYYSTKANTIGVNPLNGDSYDNLQEFLQEVKDTIDSPNNIIQQIALHNSKTASVHGIPDTSKLVTISMLSDAKTEMNNKVDALDLKLVQRINYLEKSMRDHLNGVGFDPNPSDWLSSGQGLGGVILCTDSYFKDALDAPFPFCEKDAWVYYPQVLEVPAGQIWHVTFYYVIRSTGMKSPGIIKLGVHDGSTFQSLGRTYKHGQDKVSSEYTDNIDFTAMLTQGTYQPAYSKTNESDITIFYLGHYIVKYKR